MLGGNKISPYLCITKQQDNETKHYEYLQRTYGG